MAASNATPQWPQLLTLLFCLLIAAPAGAEPMPPFTADYKVYRNSLSIGKSRISLKARANGEFLYESMTRASGILAWFRKDRIHEYSRWTLHEGRIRPLEYRYENSAKGDDRTEQLNFDWEKSSVQQTKRKPVWKMSLPENTLDKVTMRLAVMLDLSQERKDLRYAIADDAKLRHYQFHVVGEEQVSTPAGDFKTLKIERIRDNKRASTTLWCAPGLRYFPVKIEQKEDNGVIYRSLLNKYSASLSQ